MIPNNVRRRYGFPARRKKRGTRKVSKASIYRKYQSEIFSVLDKKITTTCKENIDNSFTLFIEYDKVLQVLD
jgi:hypothetical protein